MCSADNEQLVIHFFNVGDGDSMLVEVHERRGVFRMLIDAGRRLENPPAPCANCCDHLKRLGVTHLNLVVITHLHEDHFCGLDDLIGRVQIDELVCSYLPERPDLPIPAEPGAVKTVQGMLTCLNRWTQQITRLNALGCKISPQKKTQTGIRLTERLYADWLLPDVDRLAFQNRVFDQLRLADAPGEEEKICASKLRNPNSMRVRLHFAGRTLELSGDCYGCEWEADAASCDLFKLPHHGDAKAITPLLVRRLQPKYAVISCSREYMPLKDRPSSESARLLRGVGARIWYTDAFDDGVQPVRIAPEICFRIDSSGQITASI